MALFNKLFSSRRKNRNKHEDNACERIFPFSNDQVRVVLFRECDFRGRKLLFDSKSVKKVPLTDDTGTARIPPRHAAEKLKNKYVEIANGYGYLYTKPNPDIGKLGEMIFGAVAMSYRGTSLKIHSLHSPSRLMCTQVFSSPRHPCQGRNSAPSNSYHHSSTRSSGLSTHSLEQSIRLDDSGASSSNSISDHLSCYSTGSDTVLVCRSVPLDVPASTSSLSRGSVTQGVIGDSGFSAGQCSGSFSSGPKSLPLCDSLPGVVGSGPSFSSGSLYKRWLRSASTSLELSGSASADDCLIKRHPRSSKLGLAVIIQLSDGQEKILEQFLMEHAALIESLIWRARQGVELAYIRHTSFVCLMSEVAATTTQWLVDLLSGPRLAAHMWLSLAPTCDNFSSISANDSNKLSSDVFLVSNNHNIFHSVSLNTLEYKCKSDSKLRFANSGSCESINNSFKSGCTSSCDSTETLDRSGEFSLFNFTKFLKSEWGSVRDKKSSHCSGKNVVAEKYIRELCELLEAVDEKHTNFFISTLLTAVLTHHLGWVATVLPPSSSDREEISKLHNPCNPLWGQLIDLYGAIGYPTKVAHTIILGTNKSELISKILHFLTYFIRCSNIERRYVTRLDIDDENKLVDTICQEKSCIPKENFKKYEDHLKEMEETEVKSGSLKMCSEFRNVKNPKEERQCEDIELCTFDKLSLRPGDKKETLTETSSLNKSGRPFGLTRTQTCMVELGKLPESNQKNVNKLYPSLENLELHPPPSVGQECETKPHEILDKVKSLGLQAVHSKNKRLELTNAEINEKVRKLCRVPKSAILYHIDVADPDAQQLMDIQEASEQIKKVFSPKVINAEKQTRSADCVFQFEEISKTLQKEENETRRDEKGVLFVLGDNEELVGLKKIDCSKSDTVICQVQETSSPFKLCRNKPGGVEMIQKHDLNEKISLKVVNSLARSNSLCKGLFQNSVDAPFEETSEIFALGADICRNVAATAIKPPVLGVDVRKNGCKEADHPSRPTFLSLKVNRPSTKFFCSSSDTSPEADNFFTNSEFRDSDFSACAFDTDIKPSTSWTSLHAKEKVITTHATTIDLVSEANSKKPSTTTDFSRSQSVPPEDKHESGNSQQKKSKYRYSGVKFNFQQYPQIVTNYMRSKNLEMSQLAFAEKTMNLNAFEDSSTYDFSNCEDIGEEVETLQTPSNASELEFTSDLPSEQRPQEKIERYHKPKIFTRATIPHTVIREASFDSSANFNACKKMEVFEDPLKICDKANNAMFEHEEDVATDLKIVGGKMEIVELPLPKSEPVPLSSNTTSYTSSLMRGVCDHYVSDMVLQGTSSPKAIWESSLRRDLALAARHHLLDQPVDEAIAILANTDTWEVQLLSSHTYVVDRGSSGVRVGMSQLVSNMLESLLQMWRLHTPPEYCLMHIEQKLQELCTMSKAVAELLMATEFCSMEALTSTLRLEVNDVPLLMAVASTHSPQVTQKYGLSFQ